MKIKNKERMQKWREAQKQKSVSQEPVKKVSKPITRKELEKVEQKREKERVRKREERKNWTPQKKAAENKKALNRYYSKREKVQPASIEPNHNSASAIEDKAGRSQAARYQALYRVNQALPKESTKRQQTLTDFFKRHSQSQTVTKGQHSVTEMLLSSGSISTKEDRLFQRLLAKKIMFLPQNKGSKVMKELSKKKCNVRRLASKSSFKLRSQSTLQRHNVIKVRAFFRDHSRTLPLKKLSSRGPTHVLEHSLTELYNIYLTQNNKKISFSFFCNHRPKNVKTQQFLKLNQALCEVCENIDLKLKALNRIGVTSFGKNKTDLLKRILCAPQEGLFEPQCLKCECSECGLQTLNTLMSSEDKEKTVQYCEWGMKDIIRDKVTLKKKALMREESSVGELVEKLKKNLTGFPLHIFKATWQQNQYQTKRNNLQAGELMVTLDFAENYRCISQDEAQSAHWNYCQVTLYPAVFNYLCPCGKAITHAVHVVSNDMTHDAAAVKIFTKRALEEIRSFSHTDDTPFHRFIQFTDGCAAQFKSKKPFKDVLDSQAIFSVPVERHFFGSRHGKNPSDGEAAVFKSAATRAVKSRRQVIQTPKDLYQFGKNTLVREGPCIHYKRSFIYVDTTELTTARATSTAAIKGIVGTRSLQAVKGGGKKLLLRRLSCFCTGCELSSSCENPKYVDDWEEVNLTEANKQKKQKKASSKGAGTEAAVTNNVLHEQLDEETIQKGKAQVDNGDAGKAQKVDRVENEAVSSISLLGEADAMDASIASLDQLSSSTLNYLEQLNEEMIDEQPPPAAEQTPIEESCPDISKTAQLKHGTWVIAKFPGRGAGNSKSYLGVVVTVDKAESEVNFLRRDGSYFVWPTIEDKSWTPNYYMTVVDAPTLDHRGRMCFSKYVMSLS